MKILKPPTRLEDTWAHYTVFLAGSIEMGLAGHWQKLIEGSLSDLNDELLILDPRRDDWDSTWKQDINNKQFKEQVDWELDHILGPDLTVFYFDPNTKSPITLMELGYAIGRDDNELVVCCPKGFWRKGNVDIMCHREEILQVPDLKSLSKCIRDKFNEWQEDTKDCISKMYLKE